MNANKIRLLTSVLFLITFISIASADDYFFGTTGNLAGKVVDSQTNEPLIGVNIVILKTNLGGVTNEKGEYKIFGIRPGRYSVQYSYIGYKKFTLEDVSIDVDATTIADVRLELGELLMEEIIVQADRMILKQDVTGTSHVIEAKQIEKLPVDDFLDIVATQPGVTRDLHIRGGRASEILFLVDGLPFTEAGGGTVGGMLPKSSISEMKILTGGFDPEYGNALSGVINIVTKRGSEKPNFMSRIESDLLVIASDNYPKEGETNYNISESDRMYLGELSFSGPLLTDKVRLFTASDYKASDTRFGIDLRRFFDGPMVTKFNNVTKLDIDLTDNIRLSSQAIVSWNSENSYEYRWRRNLSGLPEKEKRSYRFSLGLSQFITENTFYNLYVSRYDLNTHLGPDDVDDMDTTDLWQYDFFLQYVLTGSRLWWADENQTQWTVKGDFTSQINEKNSLKFGGEIILYDMDINRVKYEPRMTYFGKPIIQEEPLDYTTRYRYKPRSGAVYIQDKMEFIDGGTLTLGARWDFLDPRASRPNLEWVPTGNDDYEKEISEWVPATMKHQISPRVGFAMPLDEKNFILANIGYFFQVPLFEYLYSGMDINLKKKNSVLVGNPDMKPQLTKAYEISYRSKIKEDYTLTVTGYNKTTENLIDTKTFLASDSKALDDGYYAQYVNSPYAESKGLEISIERTTPGLLFGRLSYTYMTAEGVSELADQELQYIQWGFDPMNTMYPLSWDQRHTISGVLSSDLPDKLTLDLVINYHSPRPYTYYPSPDGFTPPDVVMQPNNSRMKHNYYLDFKAAKTFDVNLQGNLFALKCYADIRNILDHKNVLWIASDGSIGGELSDPGAWDAGRRTRLGIEISFK